MGARTTPSMNPQPPPNNAGDAIEQLIQLSSSEIDQTTRNNHFQFVMKELLLKREKEVELKAERRLQQKLEEERREAQKRQDALLERLQEQQLQAREDLMEVQREMRSLQTSLEQERREHSLKQDKLFARQDELIARQEQERREERREALEQQERQQTFFREVIQQLQDEVKVLRHNESTQGEVVETPGGHRTPVSSSPYSMTPLSLMMETPRKPFEDLTGDGEVVENFAAGDSRSVDDNNNYVENDAVEEEEPTSVMESDQGYAVSDEIQRAKGRVTFEETFLLNKSDQVGNKVENEKGKKLPKITKNKSRALRDAKETMKMIGGKQKLILMLSCNIDQKEFFREPLHCISTWLTCIALNSLLVNRLINNKPYCRANLQA